MTISNNHIDDQRGNMTKRYDKVHFERVMRFDKKDMSFVMIAVALQIGRQWLSEQIVDHPRVDNKIGADAVKHSTTAKWLAEQNYGAWILGAASYDAIVRTPGEKRRIEQPGISGNNHRYKTVAHDPILGYLLDQLT